jgi:uncharacterized iron-regulated membrane protein
VKAYFHRPQSVAIRRALFQVHLWIGIAAGLYIAVVSITGAALVFRIDLQRYQHPHLFTPSAEDPPADAAAIMERMRDAFPGGRLSGIDAPTTGRPTYLAYVMQGDRFLTVLADPITGTVLGELPERSFVRTLQDLHFDLLGGRTGRMVNGIGAGLLLLMCLTGLVIWWPGASQWRRGFGVRVGSSWKRVNWDLHSATGIWTVVVIGIWSVTGIYFAFPSQFRATVNAMSTVTVSTPPRSTPPSADAARQDWRTLVARAQALMPGQHVARVVVPASDSGAFLVMFSDRQPTPAGTANLASIYLDQFSGAVLQEAPRTSRTTGDVIMAWVAPLHVGSFGGNVVRVAWLIIGLSPPLLFATGFLMWWTRVIRPAAPKPEAKAGHGSTRGRDRDRVPESVTDREALTDPRWSNPWTQPRPSGRR